MRLAYVEFDKRARAGKFFQKSTRRPMLKQMSAASKLLGGEVLIEWEGDDL